MFSGISSELMKKWNERFPESSLGKKDTSYLKAMNKEPRLEKRKKIREDFLKAVINEFENPAIGTLNEAAYQAVLNWTKKDSIVKLGSEIEKQDIPLRWVNIITYDFLSFLINDSGITPDLNFSPEMDDSVLGIYQLFIRKFGNKFGILWITDYHRLKKLKSAYDIAVKLGLCHFNEYEIMILVSFKTPSDKIAFFPTVIDAGGHDAFFPSPKGSKTGFTRDLSSGYFSEFPEWIMQGMKDFQNECEEADLEFPEKRVIGKSLPEIYLEIFPK